MNKFNEHTPTRMEWEQALSRSGSRITQPRRIILDVIARSPRPLTPIEVYDQARTLEATIGLVTVYRTIEKLVQLKLVDRVHQSDHCQTIFRATQTHRHLLVCSQCGTSTYFDGLDVEAKFESIGQALGYQVTHHWLQLEGLCKQCQK